MSWKQISPGYAQKTVYHGGTKLWSCAHRCNSIISTTGNWGYLRNLAETASTDDFTANTAPSPGSAICNNVKFLEQFWLSRSKPAREKSLRKQLGTNTDAHVQQTLVITCTTNMIGKPTFISFIGKIRLK